MSAWMCEDEHFAALVNAADRHARHNHGQFQWTCGDSSYELSRTGEDAIVPAYEAEIAPGHLYPYPEHVTVSFDTLGAMLAGENRRSVNHRYDESEDLTPYRHLPVHVSTIAALKAIDCYEYQSCEHPEWEASAAHAFCEQLRRELIGDLPGYDDAPWGIDRSNVKAVAV